MKTTIDEAILTNPSAKVWIEKATRLLEAELDGSSVPVEAKWDRVAGDSLSSFDLTLAVWEEAVRNRYAASDLANEEKLASRFNRHWRQVLQDVMHEWVKRAEARVIEYANERE